MVADTPFFSQLFQGIDTGCKKQHYYLNMFYLDEGADMELRLKQVIHFDCRGILLLGTEMGERDLLPFLKLDCLWWFWTRILRLCRRIMC